MNTIKFQTISNYIFKNAADKNFPVDTAEKLRQKRLNLRDNTEFIRAEVDAAHSGEKNLLTPNGLKLTGVQSFKGQSLDKLHNQVITAVRVAYATDEYSGKEASLVYRNDENSVPAGLKAASLILRQSGKTIIEIPVMDLIKPGNDGESAYTELSAFALLKEDQPFDIIIDFPIGTVLGAGKHYVEVAFKGMGTFER
jgi:hypothetical protein